MLTLFLALFAHFLDFCHLLVVPTPAVSLHMSNSTAFLQYFAAFAHSSFVAAYSQLLCLYSILSSVSCTFWLCRRRVFPGLDSSQQVWESRDSSFRPSCCSCDTTVVRMLQLDCFQKKFWPVSAASSPSSHSSQSPKSTHPGAYSQAWLSLLLFCQLYYNLVLFLSMKQTH